MAIHLRPRAARLSEEAIRLFRVGEVMAIGGHQLDPPQMPRSRRTRDFSRARDEHGMTNLNALDVGNSIEPTGRAVKGNAQIAGAGLGLSVSNRRKQNQ